MTVQETGRAVIAVPILDGKLCSHFGHCEQFAFYDVDLRQQRIEGSRRLEPPPHEPGLLPRWLHQLSANVVIAGGIGQRARDIFQQHGIEVIAGAPVDEPQVVVQAYLDGQLSISGNPCDH